MRTETVNIYKFNELSEKAQQKAIEQFSTINVDYDWYDFLYDDAETIGLKITSFDLNRNRHAEGEFLLSANEIAQNIFNNHGQNCDTYKLAHSFMEKWQPVFNEYMQTEEGEDKLLEIEGEFQKSLIEEYSLMLQKEYEYLQSEESIKETIEVNDYEFYENGKKH